jgi:hypothetical protein
MSNPFGGKGYVSNGGGTNAIATSPNYSLSAPVTAAKGVTTTAKTGFSDVMQGRLTLAALELIILGMVGFYVWTHGIQGGG